MNHAEAMARIQATVCHWLAGQHYLRSFQLDMHPDGIEVTIVANNFFWRTRFSPMVFLSGSDSTASILAELERGGEYIRKKLAHVADPNRLPG